MNSEDEDVLLEDLKLIKEFMPEQKKKFQIDDAEVQLSIDEEKPLQQIDAENYFEVNRSFLNKDSDFSQYIKKQEISPPPKKKKYIKIYEEPSQQYQKQPLSESFKRPNISQKQYNFYPRRNDFTMKSPQHIFHYFGVKITVLYSTYLKEKADVLIIPTRAQMNWKDLPTIFQSNTIADKMKENIDFSEPRVNKDIFYVRSDDIFHCKNYPWTYIFRLFLGKYRDKKPGSILQESFMRILDEMNRNKIESNIPLILGIAIPKFRWCQSLPDLSKAQIVLDCILVFIRSKTQMEATSLKDIKICINEMDQYFCFVNVLRNIIDEFIKTGNLIP